MHIGFTFTKHNLCWKLGKISVLSLLIFISSRKGFFLIHTPVVFDIDLVCHKIPDLKKTRINNFHFLMSGINFKSLVGVVADAVNLSGLFFQVLFNLWRTDEHETEPNLYKHNRRPAFILNANITLCVYILFTLPTTLARPFPWSEIPLRGTQIKLRILYSIVTRAKQRLM